MDAIRLKTNIEGLNKALGYMKENDAEFRYAEFYDGGVVYHMGRTSTGISLEDIAEEREAIRQARASIRKKVEARRDYLRAKMDAVNELLKEI
jgi:hypothetical protein